MSVDEELLHILSCPRCKGALRLDEDGSGLVCQSCALCYEVRDGIPIMLSDEARVFDSSAVQKEPER